MVSERLSTGMFLLWPILYKCKQHFTHSTSHEYSCKYAFDLKVKIVFGTKTYGSSNFTEKQLWANFNPLELHIQQIRTICLKRLIFLMK